MCLNPIVLKPQFCKQDGQFHSYTVPCGKCLDCKRQYQNSWFCRLYEESKNWSNIIFFTLTYRDKINPRYKPFDANKRQLVCPFYVDRNTGEVHRTVYKKHIQDWFKRFRINAQRKFGNGKAKPCKYFITSEYGPRTLRPHYHGILFGFTEDEFRLAYEDWCDTFGNVEYSVVHCFDEKRKVNAMRYVSKYCSKGMFENPKVSLGLVKPTFHLISKKVGYSYIPRMRAYHLAKDIYRGQDRISNHVYNPEYLEYIINNRRVYIDGISYSMPRYYREKIYGTQNNLSFQMSRFVLEQHNRLYIEQLESLCSTMSASEAVNFIVMQNIVSDNFKYRTLFDKMSRFYDKSRL